MVLTPQIEHCECEQAILPRSLTFRSHSRKFERLLPLREALTPDGRHVMQDMMGELPRYDAAVGEHDRRLEALAKAANALYGELTDSAAFAGAFAAVVDQIRSSDASRVPTPDAVPQWMGYVAADVVNGLEPDLNSMTSEWAIWNMGASRFKALAPSQASSALEREKSLFAGSVEEASKALFALRKELSRRYDLPVVPIPGVGVEGSLD